MAAVESCLFDVIMVSTDDPDISAVARACGAEVPFVRSSETADDHATTEDVLKEVLGTYAGQGIKFELACCLYPTAPFIQAQDLIDGRSKMIDCGFDMVMPITRFDNSIWRSLKRDEVGRVALNFKANEKVRSQDLPHAYYDAGQWYWFNVDVLTRDEGLMGPNTGSIVLPAERVQDIDTEEDWIIAELKHEKLFVWPA